MRLNRAKPEQSSVRKCFSDAGYLANCAVFRREKYSSARKSHHLPLDRSYSPMKFSSKNLFLAVAVSLLAASTSHAATWTLDANGSWSTGFTGGTPNATDAIADFSTLDITAARTVTLDQNATVGTINFGDTGATGDAAWTISTLNSRVLNLATSSGAPTINLGTPNGNVGHTISTALSGNQGLTVNATSSTGNQASLTLSGSLTGLSGALTINGGRVTNNGGSSLGGLTSVTVASGGQIGIWGTGTGSTTYAQNFTIAGNGYGEAGHAVAIRGGNAGFNSIISGTVTLSANAAVGANGGGLTFTNTIAESAAGSLLTIGDTSETGTVTLLGANTYTGGTTVNNGTLSFANGSLGTTGNISMNGGTLQWNGTNTQDVSSRIVMNTGKTATFDTNGNNVTFATAIGNSTTAALTKTGTGTLTLSGNNTYTGVTAINAGTLAAGTDGVFGTSQIRMGGGTIASSDGTARTFFTGKNVDLAASSTFGTAGTGNLKFNDGVALGNGAKTVTINNAVTEFAGVVSDTGTASNNFTKAGNGTLILSGANTYSFHKTAIDAGTLELNYSTNNNSKLSDTAEFILNGGTLTLGGTGVTNDHTELVGSTTLRGAVTINRSGDNTAKIALAAITRNVGGALDVATAGLATTTTANVNGILNGVTLGGALAANDGANNIVAYTGFTPVNRLGGTIGSDTTTNVQIIEAGASGGVGIAPGTTDINTLSNAGTGGVSAVNIGTNNTLRLGAVGTIASAAGSAGLTISGGTLTAGTNGALDTSGEILVANQSAAPTVINSLIANNGTGAVSLTKSGTGTLELSGANTFTGDTTISAGTLKLTHALALQNSALAITNGSVIFDQSVASHAFTVGGLKGSGNIVLQDNANSPNAVALTVNQAPSTTSTFAGVASGTGSLTKTGAGTQILTNSANTYTGGTTVNSGELQAFVSTTAGAKSTFGTGAVTVNSSTLRLKTGSTANVQTWANDINLNSATLIGEDGTQTINGTVTLTGTNTLNSVWGGKNLVLAGLVKDGASAGSLNITGNTTVLSAANTYTGGTTFTSGILQLGNASALGTGTLTITGAGQDKVSTVPLAGAVIIANAIALNNAGDSGFQMRGGTGNSVNLSGNITGTTARLFLNNSVSGDGAAIFTLSGNNSFTATTSVYVNRGSLRIGSATALGDSTNLLHYDSNAGTLSFAGSYSIPNNINFTWAAQNLDTEGNNVTLSGIIGGTQNLTKIGTGTLTFTNTNSYTGTTTVNAGTLLVNGSITTSSLTTVKSGATLGGSGTVGALTVEAGGNVNPGNSPGTLNTGNFSLSGALNAEINGVTAGTQHDSLNVTGTVTLTGSTLNLAFGGGYTAAHNDLLFLLTNDDSDAITGTFSNYAEGAIFNAGGQNWMITYLGDSITNSFTGGNDVALMAVPEPATALLGGLGLLGLLRRRRA